MARYSSKNLCSADLSDGSTIRFILPRENHLNQAHAVYMGKESERESALYSQLTEEQRAEVKKGQDDARAAKRAAPAEPKSKADWRAKQWGLFEIMDHETLVAQCAREWLDADATVGAVVEIVHGDNGKYEGDYAAVPACLLKEAAEAIFASRVGRPDAIRGN